MLGSPLILSVWERYGILLLNSPHITCYLWWAYVWPYISFCWNWRSSSSDPLQRSLFQLLAKCGQFSFHFHLQWHCTSESQCLQASKVPQDLIKKTFQGLAPSTSASKKMELHMTSSTWDCHHAPLPWLTKAIIECLLHVVKATWKVTSICTQLNSYSRR